MSDQPSAGLHWRPTPSFLVCLAAAAVLSLVAIVFRRLDAAVFATPFIVVVAWSIATRPVSSPRFLRRFSDVIAQEGTTHLLQIEADGITGAEQLLTGVSSAETILVTPRRHDVQLVTSDAATVQLHWTPARWGTPDLGACRAGLLSPWAAFRWGPVRFSSAMVRVTPRAASFESRAAMPHPVGLVGRNQSRRRGDGTEFADIRPFVQGDRLRRIHWPVSARSGELHVRTTYAELDAELAIMLDASTDMGISSGIDDVSTSLDLGVRAAAALAGRFLAHGERVGLDVIGSNPAVHVPVRAGMTQLQRLVASLSSVRPGGDRHLMSAIRRVRCSPGALVVLISPLMSEQILAAAASLTQRGLTVMVVDCLPADVRVDADDAPLIDVALRLRLLEREVEIAAIRQIGVTVTAWNGPGSLDTVLRELNRRPATSAVLR